MDLADAYGAAGRIDEAIQLEEQVLADREQLLAVNTWTHCALVVRLPRRTNGSGDSKKRQDGRTGFSRTRTNIG